MKPVKDFVTWLKELSGRVETLEKAPGGAADTSALETRMAAVEEKAADAVTGMLALQRQVDDLGSEVRALDVEDTAEGDSGDGDSTE